MFREFPVDPLKLHVVYSQSSAVRITGTLVLFYSAWDVSTGVILPVGSFRNSTVTVVMHPTMQLKADSLLLNLIYEK